MNEIDLSYVAGYFDGEGSVAVYKAVRGYSIQIKLGNTFKPAVLAMQKHFGGSVGRMGVRENRRQAWLWQVSGKNAYDFLVTITPYLHEKKAQAKEVMAFYEIYGGTKNRSGRGGRTPEEKADQEVRYQRIKALKVVEYA